MGGQWSPWHYYGPPPNSTMDKGFFISFHVDK